MSDTSAAPPAFESPEPAGPGIEDDAYAADPAPTALPAVVAVVATNGSPSLEGCLRALAAQEYPELTVLVVNGGDAAEITPRIAAVDPKLLVIHREGDTDGPVAAVELYNEVLGKVSGAPFLLLVRDDVALDASATRVMVEEAFRSNAAVVGPKLVAADQLDVLLDVGNAIDHYGTPFSPIEPGERDQEQHDGVRDVFFVSHRAMLVRSDIFVALDGFDPDCSASAEIDFSWRARLVGARVLVAPDARGRVAREHARAAWPPPGARAATAGRVRSCVKSASTLALAWSVPISFAFTVVEAIAYLVRRRAPLAGAVLQGWFDALRSTGALLAARSETQAMRVVDDSEYRVFMIRGNARIRTLLTRRLHVDDRLADASFKTREVIDEASGRFRHAELVIVAVAVLLTTFATRGFVTGSVPNVGGFARWISPGHLFDLFTTARRDANLGSDHVAAPMFGFAGVWSIAFLGRAALAHTALIVLAGPVGIVLVFRLLRRLSPSAWPAVAGAVAYAANPVLRNAIAESELGAVIAYAAVPAIFTMALVLHEAGRNADTSRRMRMAFVGIVVVTATVAAWSPVLVLAPVAIMIALFSASVLVGDGLAASRFGAPRMVVASIAAFVLLAPWALSLFSGDGSQLGLAPRRPLTLLQLLSFQSGPNGAGALALALVVSALLPLLVAQAEALRIAVAGWVLAVLGFGIVFVVQQIDATTQLPELGVLLAFSAFGLAVAIGVGVAAVVSELRTFAFGLRQVSVVIALLAIVVPVFGWLGDVGDGRARAPHDDWDHALNWMDAEAKLVGDFRVLWIGAPAALPAPGLRSHGVSFAITNGSNLDAGVLLAPSTTAASLAGEAVELARRGSTTRLGHLLGPMSIRYVAVVERRTPDSESVPSPQNDALAMNDQLDLTVLDSSDGLSLFRNLAWAPRTAAVPRTVRIPSGAAAASDPTGAALTTDLSGARKLSSPAGPATLLQSDSGSDRFRATLDGRSLPRLDAFGWSNGWTLSSRGKVAVVYDEPWWRIPLLLFQVVLWLGFIFVMVRGRRQGSAA